MELGHKKCTCALPFLNSGKRSKTIQNIGEATMCVDNFRGMYYTAKRCCSSQLTNSMNMKWLHWRSTLKMAEEIVVSSYFFFVFCKNGNLDNYIF